MPRARARFCTCAPAKPLIGTIGKSGRGSAISRASPCAVRSIHDLDRRAEDVARAALGDDELRQ
jgi:hypothetical protein